MYVTPEFQTYAACGIGLMLIGLFILSMRSRKVSAKSRYTLYAPSTTAVRRPALKSQATHAPLPAPVPLARTVRITNKGLDFAERAKAIASLQRRLADAALAPVITPVPTPVVAVKSDPLPIPVAQNEPVAVAEVPAAEVPAAHAAAAEAPIAEVSVPIEPPQDAPMPAVIPATLDILSPEEIGERIAKMVEFSKLPTVAAGNTPEPSSKSRAEKLEEKVAEKARIESPAPSKPASRETSKGTDMLSFYGMPQQPFDVTPDPAYLYRS